MHPTNKTFPKFHGQTAGGPAGLMSVIDMSGEFINFAQSKKDGYD